MGIAALKYVTLTQKGGSPRVGSKTAVMRLVLEPARGHREGTQCWAPLRVVMKASLLTGSQNTPVLHSDLGSLETGFGNGPVPQAHAAAPASPPGSEQRDCVPRRARKQRQV